MYSIRRPTSWKIFIAMLVVFGCMVCTIILPNENQKTFLFYMIIFVFSLFFATLSELSSEEKWCKRYLVIGLVIMGSVMAFRAQTGIDDLQYKSIFQDVEGRSLVDYLLARPEEKGYLTINYILYYLTNGNYNLTQVVISYFSFYLWGKAFYSLKNNCSIPIMFLILWTHYYLLIYGAALVRIFIAIPIVLYSLQYVWKGELLRYFGWIVIASCFHLSAAIMLILGLLIVKRKWFIRHYIFFGLIMAIIIPIGFIFIAQFLAPLLGEKYAGYAAVGTLSLSASCFDVLPVLIVGRYYYPVVRKENKCQYTTSMILVFLTIIFSVYASMVPVGRVTFYSNLGVLIMLSMIIKLRQKKDINALIIIGLIVYALFYMMYTGIFFSGHFYNLFPYRSFWGEI